MRPPWLAVALVVLMSLLCFPGSLHGQNKPADLEYRRRNSFGLFGEYSNSSSHIVLGAADQRKLLNFGAFYSRSLVRGRGVDFQYLLEVRPVILESDPLAHYSFNSTVTFPGTPPNITTVSGTYAPIYKCQPFSNSSSGSDSDGTTYTSSSMQTCGGRQWTFAEGMSPVGIKLNFRTHHRLQPVFTGLGGYMFSTRPIPVAAAGSFNFTFEFGAGVELYQPADRPGSRFSHRSIRAEYRYHHLSNHSTADQNPGVDNGMLQLTYAFGR